MDTEHLVDSVSKRGELKPRWARFGQNEKLPGAGELHVGWVGW
jgi:hypothetical protein